MKVILKKLVLTNFRDANETFEFDEKLNEFRGKNGTGKTTVFDAETWLRTGKNSAGKADFDIKTIRSGKAMSKTEHSVKGFYLVDGVSLILERIYSEKWTKTRGKSAAEKDGHKTVYKVDENAATKKKDFDQKVNEVFGGEGYKLCTDAGYFAGLHWQKKREILSGMTEEIDLESVIDSIDGFRKSLGGKTPDEKNGIAKERKAAINSELGKLPGLINENKRTIAEASKGGLTIEDCRKAVELTDLDVFTAEKKISNFQIDNVSETTEELSKLYSEASKAISAFNESKQRAQQELSVNERLTNSISQSITDLIKAMEYNQNRIKLLEKDFYLSRDLTYEHSGNSCKCCGESFECPHCDEDSEEQEKLFNVSKSNKIKAINEEGVALEEQVKQYRTKIEELEKQKKELEQFVPDPCLKIDEPEEVLKLKAEIEELEKNLDEPAEMPESFNIELAEAKAKLSQAQEDLAGLRATESASKRIAELENEQAGYSREFDQIEGFLFMFDQYVQKVAEQTEAQVSVLFGYVNFRMFTTQENGAVVPACDILNDELKPYETAMSNGERVRAQLDILNTFQRHHGISGPVFVDNCESVTNPQQLDSQMIKLTHDADVKTLTLNKG